MTVVIRASSTDRVLDCSGSLIPAEHAFNPNSNEARAGNALHEIMAEHVSQGGADVDRYAQEFDVELDELGFLYGRGKQALAALAKHLPHPRVEHAMSMQLGDGVELCGKSDVVSTMMTQDGSNLSALAVVDWKAGYVKRQYAGQVRSYALLLRAQHSDLMPTAGYVLGVEAYLRLGELEVRHITKDDLDGHASELLHQVHLAMSEGATPQYGPGDACQFCPRRNECGARNAWVQTAATALTPFGGSAPVTRERLGQLVPYVKALRSALAQFDSVLIDALVEGPVPLGDGKQMRLVVEEQEKIGAAALPLLREQGFTEAELARCTRIAKTELLNIVGEKSPRGLGKRNKEKVLDTLRAAGVVESVERREKVVEPIPPATPTQEQKS